MPFILSIISFHRNMSASDSFGQDKVRFNKDLDADDFRDEEIDTTSLDIFLRFGSVGAEREQESHESEFTSSRDEDDSSALDIFMQMGQSDSKEIIGASDDGGCVSENPPPAKKGRTTEAEFWSKQINVANIGTDLSSLCCVKLKCTRTQLTINGVLEKRLANANRSPLERKIYLRLRMRCMANFTSEEEVN